MADFSRWQERNLSASPLLLDPKNPRIPPAEHELSQRDLIAELVTHDHVYELAKDIVEHGYSPIESLIGVVEDGKTYILEGNRRLAAVKLLASPELAPESSVKKFRNLSNEISLDSIKKLRVVIAPDREAAAPLIMQKHTRVQIERWSPLMQARFFKNLAGVGVTPKELSERYGAKPSEIAKFLRTDTMYQIACAIETPAEVSEKVHDPRNFPASTLERLTDIPKVREFLGIQFDANGGIRGTVHPEEFTKGFRRILKDIADGKIDTRSLNSTKDVARYLKKISADAPDKTRPGHFTDETLLTGGTGTKERGRRPGKPPKKPGDRKSRSLIPHGTNCTVKSDRIQETFIEMRKLRPVERYQNTSGVMLRVLLELSVSYYLEKSGKMKQLLAQPAHAQKPNNWSPTLRHMMTFILTDNTIAINNLARKRLAQLLGKQGSLLSFEDLDGYVHNHLTWATPRDLRGLWAALADIFAVTLTEP